MDEKWAEGLLVYGHPLLTNICMPNETVPREIKPTFEPKETSLKKSFKTLSRYPPPLV